MSVTRPSIIVVCGPTASGKSLLGLELAEKLKGEIVSADSMQVYTLMDIGTDKPSMEVQGRVIHHAINLVYPNQLFDAGRYREAASRSVESIHRRGRMAVVVGGTGLYIRALLHGLVDSPPIPPEIGTTLRREADQLGTACLYEQLESVDPSTARDVHPRDAVRIIRALAVYRATGRPIGELRRDHGFSETRYRSLKLGVDVGRHDLYKRIEARVDRMIERGLVGEVETLLNLGYDPGLRSMQGIGYRQMTAYLHGEFSLERAIELIKRDTRRYAKRQWTWFKRDSKIHWLMEKNMRKDAMTMVKNFLKL